MIEKLKYALFSIPDYEIYRRYFQTNDSITIYYKNVIVKASSQKVSVYYDPEEPLIAKELKYINKENTIKTFDDISSAINYMNYLSLVTSDIRYTLYHYFLHQLEEIELNYNFLSFGLAGNYPNFSDKDLSIRCDLGDLTVGKKKVKYNIIIIFNNDGSCRLSFYPEDPAWNEEKICPERDVDKTIEYILNLKVDHYKDIPLIQS
ncbi:hypothetical protein [uncultured Chryseobacterium sp.]|uniref:hypothetical protein n=1 Tax=uncultured Chryseobacterium sp. TaxID=259322 RepID=UPI0026004967|nr:hypothetical protein [uncultured Chryseobacterium sp.]